jgi:hypothetical protein
VNRCGARNSSPTPLTFTPSTSTGFSTNVDNNSTDGYFDKYAVSGACCLHTRQYTAGLYSSA